MTEEYCKDLCAEVRMGRIDPVRGEGGRVVGMVVGWWLPWRYVICVGYASHLTFPSTISGSLRSSLPLALPPTAPHPAPPLPQVVGREREVSRVCQILARRTKNNPILLGEPGVGKTAIAEGLAAAIVHRTALDGAPLPAFLHGKRILQLDVGLLIAGGRDGGGKEARWANGTQRFVCRVW